MATVPAEWVWSSLARRERKSIFFQLLTCSQLIYFLVDSCLHPGATVCGHMRAIATRRLAGVRRAFVSMAVYPSSSSPPFFSLLTKTTCILLHRALTHTCTHARTRHTNLHAPTHAEMPCDALCIYIRNAMANRIRKSRFEIKKHTGHFTTWY